jgi:hypothetical protein
MRRRTVSRKFIEIELFPFLSVLACTIGTLILLIIVASTQILSSQPEVTIVARNEDGQNEAKTPFYIECRENGIVIHPGEVFVPQPAIAQPNSALGQLLNRVSARRDREYLIVAVRPDGLEVFREVRDLIEQRDIDIGYEPIDKGWQLKLQETPAQ